MPRKPLLTSLLGVALRHQVDEQAQALLGPSVEDTGLQHLQVLLVQVDRLLIERKRFLLEGQLVLLQVRGLQLGGPLGLRQVERLKSR